MNNVNYATDGASVISTASTNVTSGSKSSLESEASKPTKQRQATDNNSLHKRSKLNTSAVDKGSRKKTKKIADIIKEYCADSNAAGRPKGSSNEATRELSVHHIAEEIVAAKPGLDGCIP
jgi:hypothetical protein